MSATCNQTAVKPHAFSCFSNRVGFNVETVEYKNISFTVWDVGGQDKVNNSLFFSSELKTYHWYHRFFPTSNLLGPGQFVLSQN